ncbi:type I-F CRISPR-associated protein Csy1 [Shewanella sp. CAL98-MNA-CIBAN-0140]|uniref:type I-F CRISPR-associated protein Csy1 n=1 Tax=Shewanella sp. CAL98-MNA-CIBAN-0140 TaxID=3140462 RepID=UPI0033169D75
MINEDIKKVQSAIENYIDAVDEQKIQDRNLDKLVSLFKDFFTNGCLQAKSIFKQNTDVKNGVTDLKKKKSVKGSSKQENIEFYRSLSNELISLFKQQSVLVEQVKLYEQLKLKAKEISHWNKYEQWLGWALDFGAESYLATHIAKLTHSSSKGTSCDVRYHNSCNKYSSQYVLTAEKPILDTAYPDNKYSSISQMYNIEVAEHYIGDLLRDGADIYLRCFTQNKELLSFWCKTFSKLIKNENKQSYFLSKQTYFPVEDHQYHLLLPLTSSSLVHAIHLKHKTIWDGKMELDTVQRVAKSQRGNKKYSEINTCAYLNKAYINVTGSNHSNASSLNGKRGGRISLLPTMPPQWQSIIPSYVNKTDVFDRSLSLVLKNEMNDLKKYLVLIKNKSLSISEPKRNAAVINKLRAIAGNFFNYIDQINSHTGIKNWTVETNLPIEQQLLFEYFREDDKATIEKQNKKWMKTLSKSYGRWLNNQLKDKGKLSLTPIHEAVWADAFLIELREFVATQEVTL